MDRLSQTTQQRNLEINMTTTTTANRTIADRSLLSFAVRVTTFTRCRVYDFADGSFFVLHDNGHVEANEFHA
jgi:hypothetical protein